MTAQRAIPETCSCVFSTPKVRWFPKTTTAERAKENLIQRRVTHLDQLADKLREDRVRRLIEPMLGGRALAERGLDEPQTVGEE
jgi:hypothetical protein